MKFLCNSTKSLLISIAMLTLILALLLSAMLVLLAIGVPAPPRMYLWLGGHLGDRIGDAPPIASFWTEDMRLVSSNIESSRDLAFKMLNINPQAKVWMTKIKIQSALSPKHGGWYNPDDQSVVISQPHIQVFLHEFAHANFDRKTILDRTVFAANAIRLYFDKQDYPLQHQVLLHTLELAVHNAKQGQTIDVFQELYAFLAQGSKGNLDNIPEYMRPYYADYLQPGDNDWSRWLASAK